MRRRSAICASIALFAAGALTSAQGAAASEQYYVPTHVPREYWFVKAQGASVGYGLRAPEYGDETYLEVSTDNDCRRCRVYPSGRRIAVRGHPARVTRLEDESDYGRVITWKERPDVLITVTSSTNEGLPLRTLKSIAEDVAPVSRRYFRRLVVGTSNDPDISELPHGRSLALIMRGHARGHEWALRAFVPRGYPLGWYDRRSPCLKLTYRRRTTYGFGCSDPTSWELVRGQVFVFGVVPGRVRRVRLRNLLHDDDPGKVVRAHTISRLPRHAFYVAEMPRDTCHLEISDAERGDIGPTGPVTNDREWKRCGGQRAAR